MKRDSHNPEILQCQVSGLFNPKEAYIFSSLKHDTCCKTRYMLQNTIHAASILFTGINIW